MQNFPETRVSLILRLAKPTDVQAWQEFSDVYGPALYSMAKRRGLQPADAEDVAQETLFAVARAIERFELDRERARFRTWLARIARNMIADFCDGKLKRAQRCRILTSFRCTTLFMMGPYQLWSCSTSPVQRFTPGFRNEDRWLGRMR